MSRIGRYKVRLRLVFLSCFGHFPQWNQTGFSALYLFLAREEPFYNWTCFVFFLHENFNSLLYYFYNNLWTLSLYFTFCCCCWYFSGQIFYTVLTCQNRFSHAVFCFFKKVAIAVIVTNIYWAYSMFLALHAVSYLMFTTDTVTPSPRIIFYFWQSCPCFIHTKFLVYLNFEVFLPLAFTQIVFWPKARTYLLSVRYH